MGRPASQQMRRSWKQSLALKGGERTVQMQGAGRLRIGLADQRIQIRMCSAIR
jgi:LEA14-like dessication related protein